MGHESAVHRKGNPEVESSSLSGRATPSNAYSDAHYTLGITHRRADQPASARPGAADRGIGPVAPSSTTSFPIAQSPRSTSAQSAPQFPAGLTTPPVALIMLNETGDADRNSATAVRAPEGREFGAGVDAGAVGLPIPERCPQTVRATATPAGATVEYAPALHWRLDQRSVSRPIPCIARFDSGASHQASFHRSAAGVSRGSRHRAVTRTTLTRAGRRGNRSTATIGLAAVPLSRMGRRR